MSSRRTGTLEAIWIKPAHGAPMRATPTALLAAGRGIAGNADQGGRRQVTIVHRERWDAVARMLGAPVEPVARRANFLVQGIALADSEGRVLRVGRCRIRVLGETTPCDMLDRAAPGLAQALEPEWGGGAYGEVLEDGEVAVGDAVEWEHEAA